MSTPGISFITRVGPGDDGMLAQSLNSLSGLTIPYQIVTIPGTANYLYDGEISRAGYETLVTPAASAHSLPSFLNWCMAHAEHLWCFRWDADFVATPGLIAFLNSRRWDDTTRTRIRIQQTPTGNNEPVLFNAGHIYEKHIFWEYNTSIFEPGVHEEIIEPTIMHASALADLKAYWKREPWFMQSDDPVAPALQKKYDKLVELLGPEPVGMARGCNPACDPYYHRVIRDEAVLNAFDINLWS